MLNKGIEFLEGPAGAIEVVIDNPAVSQPKGLVVIAHPQPLLGGSAQHKIPHFLAKGFAEEGWLVVRPNFRGVGASAGSHDYGEGETQDMLELVKQFRAKTDLPLVLMFRQKLQRYWKILACLRKQYVWLVCPMAR